MGTLYFHKLLLPLWLIITQMKRNTLYISDLDGTLLNKDSIISEFSRQTLSKLNSEGAKITIATARTPATADILVKDCGITVPMIVITGAAYWSYADKNYISPTVMSRNTADFLLETFDNYGISPFVYSFSSTPRLLSRLDVYHKYPVLNNREHDFYDDRKNLKTFFIGEQIPEEKRDKIILMFAIGPTKNIKPLAEKLKQTGCCSVSDYPDIFDPESSLIEVFAPDVSKANAVTNLKKMLGADRVVVFGDNLNDISMMQVADVAVAVSNAFPEVKEAADIVIGSNDDDAVAKFILEDFHS